MKRGLIGLAVLLAMLISSTACTGLGSPDTFDLGGSRGSCGTGDTMTWGDIMVRPEVDEPVRISRVELVGAKDIELIDAVLVADPTIGSIGSYPPERSTLREYGVLRAWQERKDVNDVVISPDTHKWNLILGLDATDGVKHATFRDVLVHFADPDDGEEVAIGHANLEVHLVRHHRMCEKLD